MTGAEKIGAQGLGGLQYDDGHREKGEGLVGPQRRYSSPNPFKPPLLAEPCRCRSSDGRKQGVDREIDHGPSNRVGV